MGGGCLEVGAELVMGRSGLCGGGMTNPSFEINTNELLM